jgi:hypothetical protein
VRRVNAVDGVSRVGDGQIEKPGRSVAPLRPGQIKLRGVLCVVDVVVDGRLGALLSRKPIDEARTSVA